MQTISKNNPLIVERAKLKDKKYRETSSLFAFDGIKLAIEAINSGVDIKEIFVEEQILDKYSSFFENYTDKIYLANEETIKKLSPDKSPDGIVCIANYLNNVSFEYTNILGSAFMIYDIQDPGNLGTIIRSARTFGIDNLILCGDCADIYNRRVARASMGALFRQSIIVLNKPIDVDFYKKLGYKILAATLQEDSVVLSKEHIAQNTVFVVGNEGHGLPIDFVSKCDGNIIIPMKGDTESLNASIASSILMWELSKIQGDR